MIFASQDPASRSFVVFLTVVVAIINVGMLVWLVVQIVREYVHEQKEEAAKKGDEHGKSLRNMVSNARDSVRRWRFNRMTPEAQQRSIRRRTIDANDGNTAENPAVTIEMAGIYPSVSSGGEVKVEEEGVRGGSLMNPPPAAPTPAAASQRRTRLASLEAERKGLAYKNPARRNNGTGYP